jgi:antirestriction protein
LFHFVEPKSCHKTDIKIVTVVQHTVTDNTIHKMTHINSNHITEYQIYNTISNNLNKKTVNHKSDNTIKYIKYVTSMSEISSIHTKFGNQISRMSNEVIF